MFDERILVAAPPRPGGQNLAEMQAAIEKHFRRPDCLHPAAPSDCSGPGIKAHSISRSSALRFIAKDGHVLGVGRDMTADGFYVKKRRVGVKQASTFTGFCSKHDSEMFRSLDGEMSANTTSVSRIHYRSVAFEHWRKLNQVGLYLELLGSEQELLGPTIAGFHDVNRALQMAREHVEVGSPRLSAYVVEFSGPTAIASSFGWEPDFDFCGVPVVSWTGFLREREDVFAFNVIPVDQGKSIAILSWAGSSPSCEQVGRSLSNLADSELVDATVNFAFKSDNTYWSEDWWRGLTPRLRSAMLAQIARTVRDAPFPAWPSPLTGLVSWKVTSRRWLADVEQI